MLKEWQRPAPDKPHDDDDDDEQMAVVVVLLLYTLYNTHLPLLIFPCSIKSRSSVLAPAHPGGPGKRAIKQLWWWYNTDTLTDLGCCVP